MSTAIMNRCRAGERVPHRHGAVTRPSAILALLS
jgi:hypothetical protein